MILGAVAYGVWWLITFSPIYLDNIDVKDAVESAYNLSNRQDDATITGSIIGKVNLSTLGDHEEDDGYGTIKTVGGLGFKDENIVITRDEVLKRIQIVVEYKRKVLLRPSAKVKYVPFRIVREGPIPKL